MTYLRISLVFLFVLAGNLCHSKLAEANPALEGYADYAAFTQRVQKLAESELVTSSSLGKTTGGREILLLTIGRGDPEHKPAIVIVGGIDAPHLVGSELALRMAESLVANAGEEALQKLLSEITLYVIARPDPDTIEKAFTAPYYEAVGNLTPTDDDRDGTSGEDPPEDLNGDGFITMMRVKDASGSWMPHPADARVLIEADPKKNERGQYRVFIEGRDNDGDEQFNEDASGGVAFNRNWPQRYQPFQAGTGPQAVSENETRAVADFLFPRTNVFAVFCFSPEENLYHPWKPDAGKEKARIRTTILSADAPYHDFLAGKYRALREGKDVPETSWPGGTFGEWSYFQYGRWTFAAPSWWLPPVPVAKKPEEQSPEEKKASEEKRGADDLNALRWFEQEKIAGFAEWQEVEHPDFPGQEVEVGGFKPYFRRHPPVNLLGEIAEKNVSFLKTLAEHRPRIALRETKVESLGGGVYRVTAQLASTGYLPTLSEMGEITRMHQRLQIQLFAPEKTVFLQGSPRVKLDRLDGTKVKEVIWLIRLPSGEKTGIGGLKAWSPEVGEIEAMLEFK